LIENETNTWEKLEFNWYRLWINNNGNSGTRKKCHNMADEDCWAVKAITTNSKSPIMIMWDGTHIQKVWTRNHTDQIIYFYVGRLS